jgi:hypothetical protein
VTVIRDRCEGHRVVEPGGAHVPPFSVISARSVSLSVTNRAEITG